MLDASYAAITPARQDDAYSISGGEYEIITPPAVFYAPVVALPTIPTIMREVANKWGVTVADLESTKAGRRFSHPRHEVWWIAKQLKRLDGSDRYSYPMIARYWRGKGGRPPHIGYDHTSIMHGCASHEKRQRQALMDRIAQENAQFALEHAR